MNLAASSFEGTYFIDSVGHLWFSKSLNSSNGPPIPLFREENLRILSVACGNFHSEVLDECNIVHEIKKNPDTSKLELKSFTNMPIILSIHCGRFHTLCVDIESSVWGFGSNSDHQLGLPNREKVSEPTLLQNLPKVKYIACGGYHSFANCEKNELYGFGANSDFELGIPDKKIATPRLIIFNGT